MDLCEWDAKGLLRAHGLPVLPARLLRLDREAPPVPDRPVVAKAQVLSGGRGKAGLVRMVEAGDVQPLQAIGAALEARCLPAAVMLEDRAEIAAELYLALAIDDVLGGPVLLFSCEGGVDVEAGAVVSRLPLVPGRPLRAHETVAFLRGAGAPAGSLGRIAQFAADLHRLMVAEDCTLVEINPLAITPQGRPVALDAKIVLDDSALGRHEGDRFALSQILADAALTPDERAAREQGFSYVEMPGDVVLISAGAGLGMMCADLLADAGFRAATFFENAAGARGDTTEARLDLAWRRATAPDIAAIVFCQVLSTRDLAPRVEALLARLAASPPPKPFYFALSASFVAERTMTAAEARRRIREAGYPAEEDPETLIALMAADRASGRLPEVA
jgi:succinyl-CoA synthetase beta subunit